MIRLRLNDKNNRHHGRNSLFLSVPPASVTFDDGFVSGVDVSSAFDASSAFGDEFLSSIDAAAEFGATVSDLAPGFSSSIDAAVEFDATSDAPPGGPTKLYFHAATYGGGGTLPSGTQSGITPDAVANSSTTIKSLDLSIGVADPNVSNLTNSAATTDPQKTYHGMWISPVLSGNQNVGGGNLTFLAADSQGHTIANFWINGLEIYVWRPSTGAKVGTVKAFGSTSLGGSEATAVGQQQTTYITGVTTNQVAAQDGDVIVVEVWAVFTQGDSTSRVVRFYYDGTTEYTAENTVTTTCASYIQFAEGLTF